MTIPLPTKSIVVIHYPNDQEKRHATGFFVDTKKYGEVCVTAAHVFRSGWHPGPNRSKVLVNGRESELIYDAFVDLGIDVALMTIPKDLNREMVICHRAGVSLKGESAFYAHAWSGSKADPSSLSFTKIWGVRFGPQEILDNDADPKVAVSLKRWKLRSDVANRDRSQPAIFQPGWSGAPVFNVRAAVEDHRVIGVLSKTNGDREAYAVSVESLEFLEPREPQTDEVSPRATAGDSPAERPESSPTITDVGALRYEEILNQRVCPKIRAPRSPYDPLQS